VRLGGRIAQNALGLEGMFSPSFARPQFWVEVEIWWRDARTRPESRSNRAVWVDPKASADDRVKISRPAFTAQAQMRGFETSLGIKPINVTEEVACVFGGVRILNVTRRIAALQSILRYLRGRVINTAFMIGLSTLFAGCYATTRHERATDNGTGIRYYEASPYLLVFPDNKGNVQWQILYLPDQTKRMMVKPTNLLGHSELTLLFRNGILAGNTEIIDTTEIPKAVIAFAQSLGACPSNGHLMLEESGQV